MSVSHLLAKRSRTADMVDRMICDHQASHPTPQSLSFKLARALLSTISLISTRIARLVPIAACAEGRGRRGERGTSLDERRGEGARAPRRRAAEGARRERSNAARRGMANRQVP